MQKHIIAIRKRKLHTFSKCACRPLTVYLLCLFSHGALLHRGFFIVKFT